MNNRRTTWRWTNKRAIAFLLPILRDLVEKFRGREIQLKREASLRFPGARGWWDRDLFLRGPDGRLYNIRLVVVDWGREGVVARAMLLLDEEKYDHMEVIWHCGHDESGAVVETWEYAKEYRGMGNGYYAVIDPGTGRTICGEWD